MAADLAYRLKDYLMGLVTTNLLMEYQDQIEVWKLYLEDVVDAANSASDQVKDTLVNANAEVQAAREQAYGIAMLLLSMVAGPAISWLGAMVKVNWAPKITSTERIEMQTREIWTSNALGKQYQTFVTQPVSIKVKNDVVNQVLGDITKSSAGFLSSVGQSALKPKNQAPPDLNTNFSALKWESFRTGLMRSLYDAQGAAKSQIVDLANDVREDAAFGDKIVALLFKQQPHLKSRPALEQEQAGMKMIAKMLNDERNRWAGTERWFFYGNDPPKLKPDLSISYEREIWAQWIRSQNIQLGTRLAGGYKDSFDVRYVVKSDSGFFMTKAVQTELLSLAVPKMFDMSSWDTNLGSALNAVEDVDDEQVTGDEVIDTPKFEAQRRAAQEAVAQMLKWATDYRPVGPLDYGTPRAIPLPAIERYTGRFSSYRSV